MKVSSLKITVAILVFVFWTNTSTPWTRPVAAVNKNLPDAQTSVPSGWRKIDADGKFSFYLPPDMRDTGRMSIENLHREYTNGRMYLSFDYEPNFFRSYENRFLNLGKDLEEIQLQVDGKKAFIFVYQTKDWKKRRTHIAEFWVGDISNHEVIMSMSVSSRTPRAMETAKTIFRTVKLRSSARLNRT
ncbi:MAG TPA: hypothetical protein VFD48_15305 [Pyrinomonadaceae bacterium]|nr:hypothetical protein [Pyrinomonadaceae bacterium]